MEEGEGRGGGTFRGVILYCPDALSWINLKKYPNLDQGYLLNVFCHIRTFYHKLCSNVFNLLNFKKNWSTFRRGQILVLVSLGLKIEYLIQSWQLQPSGHSFHPHCANASCFAAVPVHTLLSILSRPPLTHSSRRQSLCKKHTAVCRKVNILRIFRRFWRFSKGSFQKTF